MHFYLKYTLIIINLSLFAKISNSINWFLRMKFYNYQENAFFI